MTTPEAFLVLVVVPKPSSPLEIMEVRSCPGCQGQDACPNRSLLGPWVQPKTVSISNDGNTILSVKDQALLTIHNIPMINLFKNNNHEVKAN